MFYNCWSVVVNLHTFQHITTICCSIYSRHGAKVCKMLLVVESSFLKKYFLKNHSCIWMLMDGMRGFFY